MKSPAVFIASLAIVTTFFFTGQTYAVEQGESALDKAVMTLRNIDPASLSPEQQDQKAAELDAAWSVITNAGKQGQLRLEKELAEIEKKGAKDNFFKLGAVDLMWGISGLESAGKIAAIWEKTPLDLQYNYVFYTAFKAAQTQDPRALPMLTALLKDDKGSIYLHNHAMSVEWPLTHEFIWGCYGPAGLPELLRIVKTSHDPVTLESALKLLGRAEYLPALPEFRKLARHENVRVKCAAIDGIGKYGHPQDFDMLIAGLKSTEPLVLQSYVYALSLYGDLRANPHLARMLENKAEIVRRETVFALTDLTDAVSLDALYQHSKVAPGEKEADYCRNYVNSVVDALKMDWETFDGKTIVERNALIAGIDRREERFELKKDDRKLTHAELIRAAADWKKGNRITGGEFSWVEDRHVLSVATPVDIDMLLEVKASVYKRLSDECLTEARILDGLIHRLGRNRYRESAGICPQVKPIMQK